MEPVGVASTAVAIGFKAITLHVLRNGTRDGSVAHNGVLAEQLAPPLSQLLVHVALKTSIAYESQHIAVVD